MSPDELARFNEGIELLGYITVACAIGLFLMGIGFLLNCIISKGGSETIGVFIYRIGVGAVIGTFFIGIIIVISI